MIKSITIISILISFTNIFACRDFDCDTTVIRNILEENNIRDFDMKMIAHKEKNRVKFLILMNMDIQYLPNINELGAVTGINLSNNKIKQLPIEFTQLINLESLHINDNELTNLNVVTRLKKLVNISAKNNRITELPNDIGDLIHLNRVDARNNELTDLPKSIMAVTEAMSILVDSNKICNLSEELTEYINNHSLYDGFPFVKSEWEDNQNCLTSIKTRKTRVLKNKYNFYDVKGRKNHIFKTTPVVKNQF